MKKLYVALLLIILSLIAISCGKNKLDGGMDDDYYKTVLDSNSKVLDKDISFSDYIKGYNFNSVEEVQVYINAGTAAGTTITINKEDDSELIQEIINMHFIGRTFSAEKNGYDNKKYNYSLRFINPDTDDDFLVFIFDSDSILFEGEQYTSDTEFSGEVIANLIKENSKTEFSNLNSEGKDIPAGRYIATFTEENEGEGVSYEVSYTFNSDGTGIYEGPDVIDFTWEDDYILMNDRKYPFVLEDNCLSVYEFVGVQNYNKQEF